MEPSSQPSETTNIISANTETKGPWHAPLNKVTTVSKILAAIVFITLPFVGFWLGMGYGEKESVMVAIPVSTPTPEEEVETEDVVATTTTDAVSTAGEDYPTRKDFENFLNHDDKEPRWMWNEIVKKDFVYQGKPGTVSQYCYSQSVLRVAEGGANVKWACFGKGAVVVSWNGNSTIVDFFDSSSRQDVFFVHEVGFNEGNFSEVKESNAIDASLVVIKDYASCLGTEGLCINNFAAAHKVDMKSLSVVTFSHLGVRLSSTGQLSWNDTGTKAVMIVPCAEGCPETEVLGLDFVSGKGTVLTRRGSDGTVGLLPRLEDWQKISWVDLDTVKVSDKTYSF